MSSLLGRHRWREWICHSNFSFLVGASHPGELVARAAELGYQSLAITDLDGVYGIVRAHRALALLRKEGRDNGLRLQYGAEIHFAKDHHVPIVMQDTLVLLARSHQGYFNLCRLLSFAHRAGKLGADVPLEHLAAAPLDDLVAIQPMRGLLRRREGEAAYRERCLLLKGLFGDRFYLGLSRHLHPGEDFWAQTVIDTSRGLGVPCLLTQDAFFHTRDRKSLSDLLHAIRHNKPLERVSRHVFPNAERCLHAPDDLGRRYKNFAVYEAALAASEALAASFHFDLDELQYKYPQEMLPPGVTSQEHLTRLTWEGAAARYGGVVPPKVAATLARELALIDFLKFADYFLTVWDIVSWARGRKILCHGRGSAANSAVCFVLGITSVNPNEMDLLFERFLSVERGDPPDIDVDFEHERREEVIQYIYERYGRDRAAMVANVITFCTRGSMRATGKALGVPEGLLDKAAAVLESREYRNAVSEATVKEVRTAREEARLKEVAADLADVPWELWGAMAEKLRGFPRHLGIHSGGFMLASKSLDWLVPQEPGTMENRTVIQWCKEDIEALGFFKIDVLALGMLTAIRKMLTLLGTHYGVEMALETVPQNDGPTYAMIQKADTVGTFQIESRAQMSMLPRLKPKDLYDLVIEVAIIRPGPIQGGMVHPFLRRRNGEEAVTYPDPRLKEILHRTLGVPIFQEQVMRIAMAVGGFTPGESNELRRHMGSFSMKGDVSGYLAKLEKGMRANGIADDFIAGIMGQMKGFAHYGFPESHAAAFAQTAYVSAYLKCHYPAAFFVALLNSQPMGFYPPHVLLQTARHLGLEIFPVCVQTSDWESRLEGPREKYGIRMGLHFVAGLREQAGRALVGLREQRGAPWADAGVFAREAGSGLLTRRDVTALAAADALRGLGIERRSAIWLSEAAPFCHVLEDVETPLALPAETRMDRALSDLTATGTTLGEHFALIVRQDLWSFAPDPRTVILAKDVRPGLQGRTITVFGWVMVRQAPPEAKGFLFMTLEDETGLINLIFNPRVRERFGRLIDGLSFLCVGGKVECDGEAVNILVNVVHAPEPQQAKVVPLGAREAAPLQLADVLGDKDLAASRNYH